MGHHLCAWRGRPARAQPSRTRTWLTTWRGIDGKKGCGGDCGRSSGRLRRGIHWKLRGKRSRSAQSRRNSRRAERLHHQALNTFDAPDVPIPADITTKVKGDQHCAIVATAAVIAKVTRDRLMVDLAQSNPRYAAYEWLITRLWFRRTPYRHRRARADSAPSCLMAPDLSRVRHDSVSANAKLLWTR